MKRGSDDIAPGERRPSARARRGANTGDRPAANLGIVRSRHLFAAVAVVLGVCLSAAVPAAAGLPLTASNGSGIALALFVLIAAFGSYRHRRATRAQLDLLQTTIRRHQTQQQQAEAALRELQQRHEAAVHDAAAGPPCDAGVTAEPCGATHRAAAASADTGASPVRILVVDDDADLRDRLRGLLSPHYDIFDAADGEAALRCARCVQPDLVVSDLLMPKLDGNELLRAMRADARLNHVPLILLTERADSADEIRALNAGADRFLHKPLDGGVLLAHVRATLRTRRSCPPGGDAVASRIPEAANAAGHRSLSAGSEAWHRRNESVLKRRNRDDAVLHDS